MRLLPAAEREDLIFFQDGSDSVGARCRKGMQFISSEVEASQSSLQPR